MYWYLKYKWLENPFVVKPNSSLMGLWAEKERLTNYVESDTISAVVGKFGTGKTSLMLWLLSTLDRQAIYVNATTFKNEREFMVLMHRYLSIIDRLKGRTYPKDGILLIDEAQCLTREFVDTLRIMWDEGVLRSIVIATTEIDETIFTAPFLHRAGERIISLDSLTMEDSLHIIESRVGENNPFTTGAMESIVMASDFNPRKFLGLCETAAMKMNKADVITADDVRKMLGLEGFDELDKTEFDTELEAELESLSISRIP